MIVICKKNLYLNGGTNQEVLKFKNGEYYKYYVNDSTYNNHHVQSEIGLASIFNDEEFYKYFSTDVKVKGIDVNGL